MLNKFRIGAAGVALVSALGMASAANAANNVDATATAYILDPINITNSSDLDFGTIVNNGGGAVVVLPDGSLSSCAATLTCLAGTQTAANFQVTGTANAAVSVTIPANVTITGPSGGLAVVTSNNVPGTPTLDGSGILNFGVGGTLTVLAGTTGGTYNNTTVNVSVAYN